ncbi:hypothetical protein [Methylobacterium sp. WL9]|uniref:hypothetical protein n=1 Tax=Methylobacterium sp. WL9 TaxID=2603898 RepID=UPI0011C84778|nr:hypothetical protein [Methylobacterium sp. WL9]TXN22151.1 hypothetical protein FV217_11800 [Methylobacterium sp. WL9]
MKEFLEASNLEIAKEPPWTHSASCGYIWDYVEAEKILAFECRVFKPDNLCYFFVGRPAYKRNEIHSPGDWEYPLVFVMRFGIAPKIKRIFPFDSGAFVDQRFPTYLTMFDVNRFDISGDQRNIGRLISLVYKTPQLYFERRPVGQEELRREHELTPRHREIEAVAKLARENATPEMDDRAAAIEVSVGEDVPILPENLLGIVIPDQYELERELFDRLKQMTTFIETYRHLPSTLHGYHARIVDCVDRIYKRAGIVL